MFTYHHQELGQYYRELQDNKQSSLLKGSIDKIQEVRFKNYTILLSESALIKENKLPVSQKKFDQFLYKLSHLKIQREITLDKLVAEERKAIESGLNHRLSFLFSDKEVIYELGAKIQFAKAFYMRLQEKNRAGQMLSSKLFVCFDSAPRWQAYDPKNESDSGPYEKVMHLFSTPEPFFHQLNVFRQLPLFTWVQVDHIRNRKFDILMEQFKTDPAIYRGMDYAHEEFEGFYQRLKSLSADRIFPYQDALSQKVSTIKWKGITEGKLSLWKKFQQREGYFVAYQKIIYELSQFSASPFFYHVQDFWFKRPFGKGPNHKVTLSFKLRKGEHAAAFRIPIAKEFQVEALSPKVRPHRKPLQKLFLLVFGAYPKQQAQRVQKLTPHIKHLFSRHPPLVLEILGRQLYFRFLKEEVLLWDQSTDLVFYYLVGPHFDLPFALSTFFEYSK